MPRDVLWAVLAKIRVPAHLIHVIKRMNADLKVTFDLSGEPVEVPFAVGVKQGCPLSPTLFLFVMQACLESLEKVSKNAGGRPRLASVAFDGRYMGLAL